MLAGITATFLATLLAAWLVARFVLEGPDHRAYLHPGPVPVASAAATNTASDAATGLAGSAEHRRLAGTLRIEQAKQRGSGPPDLATLRRQFDDRGSAAPAASTVRHVDIGGIAAEWLVPPTHVPGRRLLYLHGGGFVMGSPRSHRPIADRLAVRLGAAVLVPDYRLQPEHPRTAAIADARSAWRWLVANGPDGTGAATTLLLAGDSAGGTLALGVAAWARDHRDMPSAAVPDAVVAFSPQTDATFSGPSVRSNLDSDVLQGPALRAAIDAPRPALLWMSLLMNRIAPGSPQVSPLFGDLHGLPPTLIQASAVEMFLDDAVRYANKARAAGSPLELQVWPHTVHAWQVFDVPEARDALDAVARFVEARVRAPAGP